ncbi:MAG: hypothetical protein IMW96_10205 [Thermoanaerobacteraceae bacterium]|nr:hypothetical protein [Thermoanaerobacteraceae bacterium]
MGPPKSAISRKFVQATRKALEELLSRSLGDKRFLVLVIDGIVFVEHRVVSALGITDRGPGYNHGSEQHGALLP